MKFSKSREYRDKIINKAEEQLKWEPPGSIPSEAVLCPVEPYYFVEWVFYRVYLFLEFSWNKDNREYLAHLLSDQTLQDLPAFIHCSKLLSKISLVAAFTFHILTADL